MDFELESFGVNKDLQDIKGLKEVNSEDYNGSDYGLLKELEEKWKSLNKNGKN